MAEALSLPESDWDVDNGPHIDGRAQMNRISIANSDAGSNALANVAMDEAIRAVQEQLRIRG
jgi:spermidine dehydrogenase